MLTKTLPSLFPGLAAREILNLLQIESDFAYWNLEEGRTSDLNVFEEKIAAIEPLPVNQDDMSHSFIQQ